MEVAQRATTSGNRMYTATGLTDDKSPWNQSAMLCAGRTSTTRPTPCREFTLYDRCIFRYEKRPSPSAQPGICRASGGATSILLADTCTNAPPQLCALTSGPMATIRKTVSISDVKTFFIPPTKLKKNNDMPHLIYTIFTCLLQNHTASSLSGQGEETLDLSNSYHHF